MYQFYFRFILIISLCFTFSSFCFSQNCEDVSIIGSNQSIEITNLTAPIEIVQVFDANYNLIFRCEGADCGTQQNIGNLEAGTYQVNIQFYTADWQLICQTMTQAVTVLPPETTTNGNCEDLQVDGSDGRIDISGLTAPIEIVQVFDENYQIIFRCEGTECGAAQTLDNLEEGVYRVNAQYYDANWQLICQSAPVEVNVSNGESGSGNNKEGVANCDALTFTSENGQITVGGLTASAEKIEIIGQNTDWQVVLICDGDCADTQVIPNLVAGEYVVKVNQFGGDGSYCYREEQVIVADSADNDDSTGIEDICNLEITNVVYPDTVVPGDVITIKVKIRNNASSISSAPTSLFVAQQFITDIRLGPPGFQRLGLDETPIPSIPPNQEKEIDLIFSTPLNIGRITLPDPPISLGAFFLKFAEEGQCELPITAPTTLDFFIKYPEVDLQVRLDTDIVCVDSQGIVQADMIITNVGTVATVNPLFIRYTDCQTNNTSSPDVQCVSRSFLSIAFGRVSENLQPGQSVRLIRPFRKRRLTDTFVIITATIDPNLSYITNINSQPSDRPEGFIRNPIFCNEISTTANCERLQFSSENGDITVEGLTTSYSKIEIIGRNTDYQVLTICDGDCAETQVIPDLANGDYTVKVNLSDDEGNFCYREENVTITNSSSNRDSKLDYDKVFRLFPNPAKDQLYLKFQQGIDEQGTVRIYNAFGQLIQALPNISFQGEAVEVDLTGYENGMYWLSVQVKGRAIIGRRFVVEHLR